MIVRNRRKRERLFTRLAQRLSRIKPPAGYRTVLSSERFQLEINKEIHRSNRRNLNPEFAIVAMDFSDHEVPDDKLDSLLIEFQDRLRVSDSIGWHQMKLAVLLPETGREGAVLACNSLLDIARKHNIDLDASISIYPWDDRLFGTYDVQNRPYEFEKGSNGAEHRWNGSESDQGFEDGFQFSDTSSSGGTAMLAAPKKQSVNTSRGPRGTGVHLNFSQSEKTPVWKRIIDIAGASIGLTLLSPLFLVVALAVKASSKGPVFFRQEREGKDGDVFHILKFRTMCADAENKKDELRVLSEQDGPAFKIKDDPRITSVGRYLRKSCVDELPQLINVLAGQMSLVGPRPLPVNESKQCLPWQRQRLTVLPGLTCVWQVHGGCDIKFADWMRMDLDYIQHRGFWYDIRLIGETAMVVLMHKGSV